MSHIHTEDEALTADEDKLAIEATRALNYEIQRAVRALPERIRQTVMTDLGHSITCASISSAACAGCATQAHVTALVQNAIDLGVMQSPAFPQAASVEVHVRPAPDIREVAAPNLAGAFTRGRTH